MVKKNLSHLFVLSMLLFSVCGLIMVNTAGAAENNYTDNLFDDSQILYVNADVDDKPLRLHVLANSDDDFDQQVKLEVRDHVIVLLEDILAKCKTKDEAKLAVQENLNNIISVCNDYLESIGVPYKAKAAVEVSKFPNIDYNGTIYSAGEYEALRIILGTGQGHNWWCVLFPPMCFVDLATEVDDDAVVEAIADNDGWNNRVAYRISWKWFGKNK